MMVSRLLAYSHARLLAGTAIDIDRLDHDVLDGLVVAAGADMTDRLDNLAARDHLAEDRVLALQPRRRNRGDEELRAVGAGPRVGHREQVGTVESQVRVDLVGEFVAWPAGAGSERVTALDHE